MWPKCSEPTWPEHTFLMVLLFFCWPRILLYTVEKEKKTQRRRIPHSTHIVIWNKKELEICLVKCRLIKRWDLKWGGCLVWNPPRQNVSGDSWWTEEDTADCQHCPRTGNAAKRLCGLDYCNCHHMAQWNV